MTDRAADTRVLRGSLGLQRAGGLSREGEARKRCLIFDGKAHDLWCVSG